MRDPQKVARITTGRTLYYRKGKPVPLQCPGCLSLIDGFTGIQLDSRGKVPGPVTPKPGSLSIDHITVKLISRQAAS